MQEPEVRRVQQFRWTIWILMMVALVCRMELIPRLPHALHWMAPALDGAIFALWLSQCLGLIMLMRAKEKAKSRRVSASSIPDAPFAE